MKRNRSIWSGSTILLLCLLVGLVGDGVAQQKKDAAKQAQKASEVFKQIMATTDNSIPLAVLDKAVCVAVFPDVIKGGFIIGGRGGRGVASCRIKDGWSAPAYFELAGGSVGLQIGAQSTDFVLLFVSSDGMKSLLKSKFEMGGDASVAAGPVGRQVGAATDLRLDAQILSYSRSKGLFAGLELKGTVIRQETKNNEAVYGKDVKAEAILKGELSPPSDVKVFPTTLLRYSKRLR
jgi:lipid-binding SYLF domain-containing protein